MNTPTTICGCGHAARVHSALESQPCNGCTCEMFAPATDPDAATEAARSRSERREQAYNALRRAVANHRLDQAHAILSDLLKATS